MARFKEGVGVFLCVCIYTHTQSELNCPSCRQPRHVIIKCHPERLQTGTGGGLTSQKPWHCSVDSSRDSLHGSRHWERRTIQTRMSAPRGNPARDQELCAVLARLCSPAHITHQRLVLTAGNAHASEGIRAERGKDVHFGTSEGKLYKRHVTQV